MNLILYNTPLYEVILHSPCPYFSPSVCSFDSLYVCLDLSLTNMSVTLFSGTTEQNDFIFGQGQ